MFERAHMSAGEPPLRPGPAFTAAAIADRVRDALDAGDPEQIGALLSPDVHWGPPGSRWASGSPAASSAGRS